VGDEDCSEGIGSKEDTHGKSDARQTNARHSEADVDEDPFRDYLDYESDRDYLSETGSILLDDDEPIETIEFGSNHRVSREDLKRKPSVRTVHQEPPDIDTEDYPNSPSPFSPTPPTAFLEPPRTCHTDAPSCYSRPSWRASGYPATAAVMGKVPLQSRNSNSRSGQFSRSVPRGSILETNQAEHKLIQPRYHIHPTGSTNDVCRSRDLEAGDDMPLHYGTFCGGPQPLDEALGFPLSDAAHSGQEWITPVPVTTAQAALSMPTAQNGSFGADYGSLRPSMRSPHSRLQIFWITMDPFVAAVTATIGAILTVLLTRAYGNKIGSIWSVPNRVFSLTAAGDMPGDVRLGLEGWCLGDRYAIRFPE